MTTRKVDDKSAAEMRVILDEDREVSIGMLALRYAMLMGWVNDLLADRAADAREMRG